MTDYGVCPRYLTVCVPVIGFVFHLGRVSSKNVFRACVLEKWLPRKMARVSRAIFIGVAAVG